MAVITVSREYGSDGEDIAKQVAHQLGYDYFGKELLAEVAEIAQTTEAQIHQYDERDESGFVEFLRRLFPPDISWWAALPYHYPPGGPLEWAIHADKRERAAGAKPLPDAEAVVGFIREVVEKLWKRDNVVIVGRGSQKSLAAKPNTLHVQFIAPIEVRQKRIMASETMHSKGALKKIQDIDRLRANFLKHHYNADWNDPKLYHLVVNTGLMNVAQAVDVIIAAVEHLKSDSGGEMQDS